MKETLQTLEDGSLRVCVSDEGSEPICAIVSSMHLVYQKLPQLRQQQAKKSQQENISKNRLE